MCDDDYSLLISYNWVYNLENLLKICLGGGQVCLYIKIHKI